MLPGIFNRAPRQINQGEDIIDAELHSSQLPQDPQAPHYKDDSTTQRPIIEI